MNLNKKLYIVSIPLAICSPIMGLGTFTGRVFGPINRLFIIIYNDEIVRIFIEEERPMQIRQEDKEFINYLRLLGAGLGAILAVLTIFHFHNNAKNHLSQQRHYIQQNSHLSALANLNLIEASEGKNNIAGEFLDNVKQDNAKLTRLEKGFWANLSSVDLAVLSAIACVAGLVSGFYSVWLISAIGTMGTIQLIRLTYKIIWRIRPDFDGGKQQIQDGNNVLVKRDKHRMLSAVLKMSVIALISLIILWLAVYYFTG